MSSSQPEAGSSTIALQLESVYRFYTGLALFMNPEAALGGKLLYAGEPGEPLLRAANIAGAASLAASADPALLRRAMHEGAVDFVVSSLDEALRILKNEIRKRQPVAVGVAVAPAAAVGDMAERGVQPDLLAPGLAAHRAIAEFIARGARVVQPQPLSPGCRFNLLAIPGEWQQPAAAFDALLLDLLAPADHANRRWVRLAPRYLSSSARRLRSIACDAATVLELSRRVASTAQPAKS